MASDGDEPLTPTGRLFLRPEMDTIIHCLMGFEYAIDIAEIKCTVQNSLMVQLPRFCSLMVRDQRGREHWRRTQIDIDRHVILIDHPLLVAADEDEREDVDSRAVNDYLAELSVSTPLSTDKPLWELHILMAHKCAVFRIHHALGDGISLMSMLLASCRRASDSEALPSMGVDGDRRSSELGCSYKEILLGLVKKVLFGLMFVVQLVLKFWFCDRKTAISGGAGVELWSRKLATARFWLEDMKAVKKAVAGATINDVLFGVVSSGLSRYLDHRSPNALPNGLQLTGLAMVNLREQPGLQDLSNLMNSSSGLRLGNKFGIILLPVYYHKTGGNPLDYVKRAKAMIDRKKQTLEAHFSYKILDLVMSWFAPKVASMLNYRIICNTSFTISNVVGPHEEITLAGIPVTFIRVNSTCLPHALTMHMVSYAGRADMQILVAKDIIPDPEFLAKCFEDALLDMKEVAVTHSPPYRT